METALPDPVPLEDSKESVPPPTPMIEEGEGKDEDAVDDTKWLYDLQKDIMTKSAQYSE